MKILAIDPGNTESAYVIVDEYNYKILEFGKVLNEELHNRVDATSRNVVDYDKTVIEMVACYGMAVGKEVFDTCVWIGRFIEITYNPELLYRKEVKINMCHTMKAKDGNIIQALKDRFGDKGTKKNPGFFFGFKADCWQAYALGVTYIDQLKKEGIE
jgi:hypothetical protein